MCDAKAAGDPYEDLTSAVARFIAQVAGQERTAWEVQCDLVRKRRIIDSLQLDFARDVARISDPRVWDDEGLASPIDWLTMECHMTGTEAWAAFHVGENAPHLERTIEKLDAGSIGYSHLVLMAKTRDAVTSSGATLDEAKLLKRAVQRTPAEFRRDCSHARHAADARAFHARQQEYADQRFLDIRASGGEDGGVWIKGCLGAVDGATLRSALEPLARPFGPDDERRREERLADALVEMAAYTLNTGGQGSTHCQVPHLHVTATVETLTGSPGSPAGELEGSVPVSGATVERLSCSASVRRILMDSESLPFDVGRARRLPSTATRIKVEHRDQGCVWPRCNRKVRWTEIHHVNHWTRGGVTEEANLICLCWKHHDDVHLRGWQVVRVDGQREVLAIPPIPPSDPLNRGPSYQHAA